MNANVVLKWLIEDANQNAERFYNVDVWQRDLKDLLSEINSRRNIILPTAITSKHVVDEEEIISILNDKYKNNISNISLILNYLYPEKYLFYRVSILENEVFAGFKFLIHKKMEGGQETHHIAGVRILALADRFGS